MNRLRTVLTILAVAAAALTAPAQSSAKSKDFRIYFVDVEGGQATLFVAPTGESLLVDTGWSTPSGRDADRIVKTAHDAGLAQIDSVLITHYHIDHAAGASQLAAKIPIGRFLDHGPNTEMDHGVTEQAYAAYKQLIVDKKIAEQTVKAGDVLDVLHGVKVTVVSSDGNLIAKPFGAAKPNSQCDASPTKPLENSENDHSIGLMLVFNKTRIVDLGDLTWGAERALICPVNKLGDVDVYIASHHGFDRSGSPALLAALSPRIAVIDNGGHKGADANAWQIIASSSRMQKGDTLWQLHTAEAAGSHNVDPARIANLTSRPDPGFGFLLTVQPSGDITVRNDRTGETTKYGPSKN